MKKLTLTLIATLALSTMMLAQQAMPVPFDQNVRRGKLENGLTYYIKSPSLTRRNSSPTPT